MATSERESDRLAPLATATLPRPYLSTTSLCQLLVAVLLIPAWLQAQQLAPVLSEQFGSWVRWFSLASFSSDLRAELRIIAQLCQLWLLLHVVGKSGATRHVQTLFFCVVVAYAMFSCHPNLHLGRYYNFNRFATKDWYRIVAPFWLGIAAAIVAWSLWSAERLTIRILAASALAIMFVFVWFNLIARAASPAVNFVITAHVMGCLLLGCVAKVGGWRLEIAAPEDSGPPPKPLRPPPVGQFHFQHLLMAITCCAVAFAVFRAIGLANDASWREAMDWIASPSRGSSRYRVMLAISIPLTGFAVWQFFRRGTGVWWIVWVVGVTLAITMVGGAMRLLRPSRSMFSVTPTDPLAPESFAECCQWFLIVAFVPLVMLSGLRAAGYRWAASQPRS